MFKLANKDIFRKPCAWLHVAKTMLTDCVQLLVCGKSCRKTGDVNVLFFYFKINGRIRDASSCLTYQSLLGLCNRRQIAISLIYG